MWVGHSCPTLLVLVLISTAVEACAFYPNGSGQECPLYTNAQRLMGRRSVRERGTQRSGAGEGRGPSTAKYVHFVKAFLRSG